MKRTLGLLALTIVLSQGTGCFTYSENRATHKSTYAYPRTVYAIDSSTGETVWTYVVPPQTKLVVDLDSESDGSELFYRSEGLPTTLSYELYPIAASESIWRHDHFSGSTLDEGEIELTVGGIITWGYDLGPAIDPSTVPGDRSIEDIEQDLADESLPDPTVTE